MSYTCLPCEYCNNYHNSRDCPLEDKLANIMKKIVGMFMEHFIANEVCCPRCHMKTLKPLCTHAPSLDIICSNCSAKFEIKSKCMSTKVLPNDLVFHHGNYNDYVNRQNNGLDIILVVYSVCRKTKIINIRNVFYAPNEQIKKNTDIHVIKKNGSSLSQIIVPNYKKLNEIKMTEQYAYDFSENINCIINTARRLVFN
jgi:hypothetical protein